MDSVKNKVYTITGLAGIGLSVAKQLHTAGARLSLADINPQTLETALGALQNDTSNVLSTVVDITSSTSVNEWISKTVTHFGRLDGAANMAGAIGKKHGVGSLVEQEDDEWEMLMRVNLSGSMFCLRAQLRAIQAGGGKGSIVNAASIQGLRGFPFHAAYSATKHGIVGLTRSVSKEVGPDIRVNAIAP